MAVRTLPPGRKAPLRPPRRPDASDSPTSKASNVTDDNINNDNNDSNNSNSLTNSNNSNKNSPRKPLTIHEGDDLPPPPPPLDDDEEGSDTFDTFQTISITPEGQTSRPLITVDFTPRRVAPPRSNGPPTSSNNSPTSFSFDQKLPSSPSPIPSPIAPPLPEKGRISPSAPPSRPPPPSPMESLTRSPSFPGEKEQQEKKLQPASPGDFGKSVAVPRTFNVEDQFGVGAKIFRLVDVDTRGQVVLESNVQYYVRSGESSTIKLTTPRAQSKETLWTELKAAGLEELVNDPDLAMTPAELAFADIGDFTGVLDKLSVPKKARFRKWFASFKKTEEWTPVMAEAYSSETEAQFFLDQGLVYQQARNLSAAVTLFEQAVATSPNFVLAQYSLAKCLSQLRQYTSAARRYALVIKLDEKHAESHLALGLLNMTHLERPVSEAISCFNFALSNQDRLSAESHTLALLYLTQAYCAHSQWDEATQSLNILKERALSASPGFAPSIPPGAIGILGNQIQNKMTTTPAAVGTNFMGAIKRTSIPTLNVSIDSTGYEEDSLHSIFLKMSSACPKNVVCRNLLKLSLTMTEVSHDVNLADCIRMQNLYEELGPKEGDSWQCTCDADVRMSGSTVPGNACSTLAAKCFLYCGGKDILLKIWNRSLRRSTTRRPSFLPPPLDPSPTSKEAKRSVLMTKIKRSSLSLPVNNISVDVDSDADEENSTSGTGETSRRTTPTLPSQLRDTLLDLLIQVWVLRLLWRFGEMSRTECLTKCSGQLANQVFVVRLEGVEMVMDAKGKKRARYDISIDTRFKKWRVGKRYKEIQEFYVSLTQAMKHSKVFKPIPVPAKTFQHNSSSEKSKVAVANFFEDFTHPGKYQLFLAEASPQALNLVDNFFCVNANQYYQMLSRSVFAESILNAVKQCLEAQAQLSSGLLSVFFEIMVNEPVETIPISESNLVRLRQRMLPTAEVGWKTSTLFHTRNSLIVEFFVLPLILEVFKCMPIEVVNGALEYLTMLLVRSATNCALFFPSLTPGSMSSSGWKSWLSYFIPKCFAWKAMDDGKTAPESGLIRDLQHAFQLSLNITILSIHYAFLTCTIPAMDAFSVASVLISIMKTVVSYRIGDVLEPAPVVVEQPERAALGISLSLESDEMSVSVLRMLLEGLLHKVISSVSKFRNDHLHPGWNNVFQFLAAVQRLITSNPSEEPPSRSRTPSLAQADASTPLSKLPKVPNPLTSSPRKHSRQLTEGTSARLRDVIVASREIEAANYFNSVHEPVHSNLVAPSTLRLVCELLAALKIEEIDSCTTFGMQPYEISQVQAHKKQGLMFVDFFKKIGELTPTDDSESDEDESNEEAKVESQNVSIPPLQPQEASRGRSTSTIPDARERALEFLEYGGELTVLIQKAENLAAQDTFISVKHGKKTFKTKTVKKNDCPVFHERFVFSIKPAAQREDSWLKIRAYEKGLTQKLIGEIVLPLSHLEQYSEKAASVKAQGATGPVRAWLNFYEKNLPVSPTKKCRLGYILFFGPEHSPWGTLDVAEDIQTESGS